VFFIDEKNFYLNSTVVTRITVCGLVDVKLALNLVDCWLNGKCYMNVTHAVD